MHTTDAPPRGFTRLERTDYLTLKRAGRLRHDGTTVQIINNHGPLSKRQPGTVFEEATHVCQVPRHRMVEEASA